MISNSNKICKINALVLIYIRSRRVVMGFRRLVTGYITALFSVLQELELNWHGWTYIDRWGEARVLNAGQTLTLLICGTWGNRHALCQNDFRYVCGGLLHWLFLIQVWQLQTEVLSFPPPFSWDSEMKYFIRTSSCYVFHTRVVRLGEKDPWWGCDRRKLKLEWNQNAFSSYIY